MKQIFMGDKQQITWKCGSWEKKKKKLLNVNPKADQALYLDTLSRFQAERGNQNPSRPETQSETYMSHGRLQQL